MALAHKLAISLAIVLFGLAVGSSAPANAQQVGDADQSAVRDVIGAQIEAFKAGDHQRAYSFAGPGIQTIFPTVDRFIEMVQRGYMVLYRPAEYRFGRSLVVNGEIYQELIVTDGSGKLWQAVYSLQRQEDGTWKITGVKLEPYKGASV